jgi:hypothetical protein
LTKLEAFRPPIATQPLFEITVTQRAFTGGDSKLSFEASSDAARGEVIGLLYSFCRSHEKTSPVLVGLRRAEMGMYAEVLEEDEEDDLFQEEDSSSALAGEDSASKMMTPRNTTLENQFANTPLTDEGVVGDGGAADARNNNINFTGGDKNPSTFNNSASIVHGRGEGGQQQKQQRVNGGLSAVEAEMDAAWSARQDTQLASLLDAIAGGGTSLNDVRSRLTAELAALEGANVHELLESAAAAGNIQLEIGSTLEMVDDIEETLGMLDAKLRHMREDMAAIEDWNNRLETHSRSNVRLLATLEGVASALMLEPTTEVALKSLEWDQQSSTNVSSSNTDALDQAIVAAWDLHRHLLLASAETPAAAASAAVAFTSSNALSSLKSSTTMMARGGTGTNMLNTSASGGAALRIPLFISPRLQSMNAVATRKRSMQELAKDFLHRATDLLEREYSHIADALVKVVAALPAGERLRIPVHTTIHTRASQLKSLLEVVVAMRPGAAAPLQNYYCKSVNTLLRKEIGGAIKDLLKQCGSSSGSSSGGGGTAGASGVEPDFGLKSTDSIKTLERICSTAPARTSSEPVVAGGKGGYHRRRSSLTGTDTSQLFTKPLEECFEILVATFFPLLVTEVEKCIELVCLGGQEEQPARNALVSLLSGIPEAILSFLDTLRPPKVIPCLAMLATTLHWQSKLSSKTSSAAASAAVCEILKQCERKLRSIWDTYITDSVASIQNYDGKSSMGGYSSVHVLPFIINLEAVASRIEGIVTEWTQRDASSSNRSRSPSPTKEPSTINAITAAARGKGGSKVENSAAAAGAPALKPSPFEALDCSLSNQSSTDGGDNGGSTSGGNGSSLEKQGSFLQRGGSSMLTIAPAAAVRVLADTLYHRVLDTMLVSVESHAAHDAKHAPRIKLENYSFLRLSLQGVPLAQAPVLQKRCSEAGTLRNAALAECVEQQTEILKLDKLVNLAGQLAELCASSMSPAEVGNRIQWTSADARQAVAAAASGLDKRFATARQKLHKHLGNSSPYLIDVVWERTAVRCGQAWEDLEQRLPAVFPGAGLVPTSEGLKTAFNAAKVASP